MKTPPVMSGAEWLLLGVILGAAALARFGYVFVATDGGQSEPALQVQAGRVAPDADDRLVRNLIDEGAFRGRAPLSDGEDATAHVAPGYYYLIAQFHLLDWPAAAMVRWTHVGLGTLTVLCLYFFARRAFFNSLAALCAGLLAAVHPFWILNTAELGDGTLATFLLAAALALGTRGSQAGGAFTSLAFGLCLAGLAMVRAALLPFGVVALLWFLSQCKGVRGGWFNALLALLGFANGLAPWGLRNYNQYGDIVPIADSAFVHLWIGNNPHATGGPIDEAALRATLPAERLDELLKEPNQAKRYASLGRDVVEQVAADPSGTFARRFTAGSRFLLGDEWFGKQRVSRSDSAPDWQGIDVEAVLQGTLLCLLILALLGWRFSFAWKGQGRLATLAFLWVPLPYLLSHAEALSGPRLPWDVCLVCFAAYALASLAPTTAQSAEES
jgi:4-amino-4-deoxy-L-arabinose transferase-like glycosyltransferase